MKSMKKLSLALVILMALVVNLQAADEAEKPKQPVAKPEVKDPALQAIKDELSAATSARDGKLAELSPDFAAAKDGYAKACAAVGKDRQNPQLKQAQLDAMQTFIKVRNDEFKRLLPSNADLKALEDKFREVQAKIISYQKQ